MSLDSRQIENFRKRLLQMRQELLDLDQIEQQSSETVELDQSRQGRLSRMDALQGQAMSQELERRRRVALRNLEAALKRIEERHYGYCVDCGAPIAERRLDYDPAAARCIACAERAELPVPGR